MKLSVLLPLELLGLMANILASEVRSFVEPLEPLVHSLLTILLRSVSFGADFASVASPVLYSFDAPAACRP